MAETTYRLRGEMDILYDILCRCNREKGIGSRRIEEECRLTCHTKIRHMTQLIQYRLLDRIDTPLKTDNPKKRGLPPKALYKTTPAGLTFIGYYETLNRLAHGGELVLNRPGLSKPIDDVFRKANQARALRDQMKGATDVHQIIYQDGAFDEVEQ